MSQITPEQIAQWKLFNPQQNPLYPSSPTGDPSQAAPTPSSAPPASNAQPEASSAPAPSPAPAPTAEAPQAGQVSSAMKPPTEATPNAPIANAPTPFHHGTLAKILLGIGEAVGNPLATHIGERDRARQQEADEYTRSLPATQNRANLEQQQATENISHTQAQTHLENVQADIAQQNLPLQEAAQKHYQTLQQTWQNKSVPDFDKYAQSYLAGLPPVMARMLSPHLQDIKNSPQTGKGYQIAMQDDVPKSIEMYGQSFQPDKTGKFGPEVPAQAVQEFQAAQGAHQTKRGEKVQDEKTVAGYAAARQAAGFQEAQTMEGRKAAQPHLNEINDARNQQDMMQKLTSGKMNPASQTAAMFKMIGLEQPTGTHRIMPAEIEGIEQMGGLSDRLKQKLLNWKQGDRFSPDLVPDLMQTAKILTQNKIKTANDNLQSTYQNTGYKVPGTDAKGRLDKPEDYQDAAPGKGAANAPPQGATHVGVSSLDGKKYYLDAQGKKLGPAE